MLQKSKIFLITALAVIFMVAGLFSSGSKTTALDNAFNALKTYKWGSPRKTLAPIDKAVAGSYNNKAVREKLEIRLAEVLKSDVPTAAKDFICRKLRLIGTAKSVPAIAPLLLKKELSSIARYALEQMPCRAAVKAMRRALPKAGGNAKIGIINSLGVRRDVKSIPALIKLLDVTKPDIAAAAAAALGSIGNVKTAGALKIFQDKAPKRLAVNIAHARLVCAEKLLAAGKKDKAEEIYKSLAAAKMPNQIHRAAMQGLANINKGAAPK